MQLQLDFPDLAIQAPLGENPRFLSEQLITYIGNKRQLLPVIRYGVELVHEKLGHKPLATADIFAGSGSVSRMLKQYSNKLYCNDLEKYSCIVNSCYLSNGTEALTNGLANQYTLFQKLLRENWISEGIIAELYAPKDDMDIQRGERAFYTRRNAEYIDSVRTNISLLPEELQIYFLAPLIVEASIHANTSGVFKGFYKDSTGIGCFGGNGKNALSRILKDIEIPVPIFSNYDCEFTVSQLDAAIAVRNVPTIDLAYLDPPYNQHPYGSNYFMLNVIADYIKPEEISAVSGIPSNWNRSPYNKSQFAKQALFDVIENCDARFLLISYNSEGFITYDEFVDKLETLGSLSIIETKYNTFRGSRNLRQRDLHVKEYLFMLERG